MSAETTPRPESNRVAVGSMDMLGDCPLPELREIVEASVREANENIDALCNRHHTYYERGDKTRIAKWEKRLTARMKVKAWLDSFSPNTRITNKGENNPTN